MSAVVVVFVVAAFEIGGCAGGDGVIVLLFEKEGNAKRAIS